MSVRVGWAGNVALVILVVVLLPSPVLLNLGVWGFRDYAVQSVAVAVCAALGAVELVRMRRQDARDLVEAHELRDHPHVPPVD